MRRRGQPGQMMVIFALTLTVFMGAMMLGVDLSRLRAETENAQRAANAAALAGVVFLPQFQDSAYSRALATAKQNSFVPSTTSGVSITTQIPDGYPNRLKVTVTEPVSLVFGKIFGLGSRTISRSSTAEFAEPLEMGASDYVLGYAPFPTSIVTATGGITPTQGFYLIARGPYGSQENGDAYSQYFEGYNSKNLTNGSSTSPATNPCANPTKCDGYGQGKDLTLNPDRVKYGFTGYDYVIDNPFNNTLVVKIFDPFDESPLNNAGGAVNSGPGLPTPFDSPGRYIDQWGCDAGHTAICSVGTMSTALKFTISGPYQTSYDTSPKQITVTPTVPIAAQIPMSSGTNIGQGLTCSDDCAISNSSDGSFIAGDDPTHVACAAAGNCNGVVSPYAYKFVNYAIINHAGLYHIHVASVENTYGGGYAGHYGNGGNVFGFAACAVNGTYPAVLGTGDNPAGVSGNVAVSDPASTPTNPWNQYSCLNPNTFTGAPAACAHPGTAPPDSCVHIYGVNRMAIINILAAGGSSHASSLVPLGYVPPSYGGKTLQVHLYDVGDIGGSNPASVQVLTPAGDLTHNNLSGSSLDLVNGTPPFSDTLPFSWNVQPTDCPDPASNCSLGSKYATSPLQSYQATQAITIGTSAHYWNGAWTNISVPIPTNNTTGTGYSDMVNEFGGYWKMLYDLGAGDSGQDTTTWEISVAGSPTHLVQ